MLSKCASCSGRLVGLLVGRLLDLKLGAGFVNLALKLVAGLLELPKALAKSSGELGKFFGSEKQNYNHEDKHDLGPSRHRKSEQRSSHHLMGVVHAPRDCNPFRVEFLLGSRSRIEKDAVLVWCGFLNRRRQQCRASAPCGMRTRL